MALVKELEAELNIPKSVRMHWTGCPNSCGQPQVAEIGFMGTKVRKDGKTVEGVDIYMGGKVGKDAQLGSCVTKGIACVDLKPFVRNLLIENFGAELQEGVTIADLESAPQESEEKPRQKSAPATVVLAKSGKEIPCDESDFILDAIEGQGLELEYSCRSGSCGTCKQKLLEGSVKYDTDPEALKELEEGFLLTCSAHPIGRVVIDA